MIALRLLSVGVVLVCATALSHMTRRMFLALSAALAAVHSPVASVADALAEPGDCAETISVDGRLVGNDTFGDPLPPGATARMGTKKLRGGEGHVMVVGSVAVSPDGKTVASAGGKTGYYPTILWEASTGRELARITGPGREGYSLAFSPDGKALMSLTSSAIVFSDTATTKELRRIRVEGGPYVGYSLSADGKSLFYAAGGRDATTRDGKRRLGHVNVTCVELATQKKLGRFEVGDENGVRDFGLSADGKILIVQTSKDQKVHFRDTATGTEQSTFACPQGATPVFSPDASLMAWHKIGEDGTIRLSETTAGKELRQLVIAEQVPRYVGGYHNAAPIFSPDGKRLAATTGKTTCVWDVATGNELERFQGDQTVVTAMGFSRDGMFLATGGDDTTVLVWKVGDTTK